MNERELIVYGGFKKPCRAINKDGLEIEGTCFVVPYYLLITYIKNISEILEKLQYRSWIDSSHSTKDFFGQQPINIMTDYPWLRYQYLLDSEIAKQIKIERDINNIVDARSS